MRNPSAIGVSILILIAATTMVGSSAADSHYAFHGSHQSLIKALASADTQAILQFYQRQVDTINVQGAVLQEPHLLTLRLPEGTTFQGHMTINGETQLSLNSNSASVDLSPYLKASENQVVITGHYAPPERSAVVDFKGSDTLVQQLIGDTGQINYQLNLVVE
jgi:hypothetical protein